MQTIDLQRIADVISDRHNPFIAIFEKEFNKVGAKARFDKLAKNNAYFNENVWDTVF